MRRLASLCALALSGGLGLWGCASASSGTPPPNAVTAPKPAPPALPASAAEAVTSDVEQVVLVDLNELRASRELAPVLGWLEAVPCLDGPAITKVLPAIARVLLAMGPSDSDVVAFIELERSGPVSPEDLLRALPGVSGAPSVLREGRYERHALGGFSAVPLRSGLFAVGTDARIRALQSMYDDPAQGPRADYWAAREDEFRPGEARAVVWASAALPAGLAARMAGLAGQRVAGALVDARSVGVLERSPVAFRMQAQLRDAAAVGSVRQTLHKRLQNASLILRLMGIPLDKRLESKQNGASLRLDLPMPSREAQRLLGFAEATWPSLAESLCRALPQTESKS